MEGLLNDMRMSLDGCITDLPVLGTNYRTVSVQKKVVAKYTWTYRACLGYLAALAYRITSI